MYCKKCFETRNRKQNTLHSKWGVVEEKIELAKFR